MKFIVISSYIWFVNKKFSHQIWLAQMFNMIKKKHSVRQTNKSVYTSSGSNVTHINATWHVDRFVDYNNSWLVMFHNRTFHILVAYNLFQNFFLFFLQSGVPIDNCIAVRWTISSVSMTHLLVHLHPHTDHQWYHLTFRRLPHPVAQSFSLALQLPRCTMVQWYQPKARSSCLHPRRWSHGSKLNHHLQQVQLNLKSKPLSVIY